jgi:hypothetical protein
MVSMQSVQPESLEHAHRRMDRGMRRAARSPAIPAPIGHLLLDQVIDDDVETRIVMKKWESIESTMPVTQVSLRPHP